MQTYRGTGAGAGWTKITRITAKDIAICNMDEENLRWVVLSWCPAPWSHHNHKAYPLSSVMHCTNTVETAYKVYVCPRGNLLYCRPYFINDPTVKSWTWTHFLVACDWTIHYFFTLWQKCVEWSVFKAKFPGSSHFRHGLILLSQIVICFNQLLLLLNCKILSRWGLRCLWCARGTGRGK